LLINKPFAVPALGSLAIFAVDCALPDGHASGPLGDGHEPGCHLPFEGRFYAAPVALDFTFATTGSAARSRHPPPSACWAPREIPNFGPLASALAAARSHRGEAAVLTLDYRGRGLSNMTGTGRITVSESKTANCLSIFTDMEITLRFSSGPRAAASTR